jgi:prevent-host-death family protein
MNRSVGAYEAKAHLSQLLDDAAAGDTITITKHGRPVAMLVPAAGQRQRTVGEAIEAILEFRRGRSLGGLSIRELIDEGRT